MAVRIGGSRRGPVADINVTPMADVMIVLLIIFMVATPFIHEGPVERLPHAVSAATQPDDRIVVAVDDRGRLFLGHKAITAEALAAELPAAVEAQPDGERVVHLQADARLPYTDVRSVLDVIRNAGADEVALIAERNPGDRP
ncbi:MAG: biopolymer transporter ExbD [Acidobacteria bacterium]|nr:biopolymer transporter ExbD [Acidobacteriota bacterium]